MASVRALLYAAAVPLAAALVVSPQPCCQRRVPHAPAMIANLPIKPETVNAPNEEPAEQEGQEWTRGGLPRQALEALQTLRPRRRPTTPAETEDDAEPSTGRLIVVSNRLPFSVKPGDEGYQFVMSSGGLVSAMLGVMEDDEMTWLGWPGIAADAPEEQATIRDQLAEHKCVPVFLDEYTADTYYNGFCNSVLWPLFHYVQDVLDTNPLQDQWEAYQRANQAFFDEIVRAHARVGLGCACVSAWRVARVL